MHATYSHLARSDPSALVSRLAAVARSLALAQAAEWALTALTALLGAMAVGLFASVRGPLSLAAWGAWSTASLGLATGLLALAAWALLSRPTLHRVALHLERRFPDLEDRLASGIDLLDRPDCGPFSPALVRAALNQAELAAAEEDLTAAADWSRVHRGLRAAGVVAVFLAIVLAAAPQSAANLLASPRPPTALAAPAMRALPPPTPTPRPGPPLSDLQVTLEPPFYTGLPSSVHTERLERLSALAGTRIEVRAAVDPGARPILHLKHSATRQDRREMTVGEDGQASASFVLYNDIAWKIALKRGSKGAFSTPECAITCVADARPLVKLAQPGRDLAMARISPVDLSISATDDFGIVQIALAYRLSNDKSWRTVPLAVTPSRTANARYTWDLAPLQLQPGHAVLYRAAATDNDAVTGPKTAYTRTYSIRIPKPSAADTAERVEQAEERQARTLEELKAQAERLGEQIRELRREVDQGGGAGASSQQVARLQEAARRAEELAGELDRAIANTVQEMARSELVTPEMMQKVVRMQQLLQETLTEDLRQALEQVQKAMGEMDPEALRRALQEADFNQQEFMRRLDQTIALLEQARLEQKLMRAAELAKKLVQEQRDLRDAAAEKADKKQLGSADRREMAEEARRQAQAAEEAEKLSEEVRELAQELTESHPQAAEPLREVQRDLEGDRPQRQMRQAAQELSQGDPGEALPQQRSALNTLRLEASALNEAQAQMLGQFRRELAGALQRMMRDALYLSQEQERLMGETRPLGQRSQEQLNAQKRRLEQLSKRQQALSRGAQGLSRQMQELAKKTPLMRPGMSQEARDIGEMMAQAGRDIQGGSIPQGVSRQQTALGQLNTMAQRLMEMTEGAASASQSMALEQYLKQLEALAQQQEGLNEQTQQMLGDGLPMPTPGQQLGQLAAEQELIRKALEKLLNQAEGGDNRLGDQLGNVPDKMEQVEEDLEQYQADRETLKTQAEILHKMLDAQRSLHTKAERPERKAEQAKPYQTPPSPPALKPYETPTVRPPTISPQEPLPLDFEDLVKQYMEAIGR